MRAATLRTVHLERDLHAAHARERIDERAGRANPWAFQKAAPGRRFYRAVGELGDFEIGVTSSATRFKLSPLFQGAQETRADLQRA